jgi:hypothetical protein
MKGDFSRYTFDPLNHFSRVLMQQGKVQLDADWNEQVAILLHYMQTLAADLIGPHGGPGSGPIGFEITADGDGSFTIGPGRYYVDGILCENDPERGASGEPDPTPYSEQPDYPLTDPDKIRPNKTYLVYLDVWERHITYIQDDAIREVALGGPDTATRAKVVWQVKVTDGTEENADIPTTKEDVHDAWVAFVDHWQPPQRGALKAKAKEPEEADLNDPCITDPEDHYRGQENQLYRVEVHQDGRLSDGTPTFKWSRDNGSVVFPIRELSESTQEGKTIIKVTVDGLAPQGRSSLKEGDWVEIVDDDYVLQRRSEECRRVVKVDALALKHQITLEGENGVQAGKDLAKHSMLRRWDHRQDYSDPNDPHAPDLHVDSGTLLIQEDTWLTLENGVQIYFQGADPDHIYRTGDYWLIPARTASGDVEWPQEEVSQGKLEPEPLPPHGVTHHYAPLALVNTGDDTYVDLRCRFPNLCDLALPFKIERVAFYNHDYLYVRDLENPSEIPEFAPDPNRTGIAVIVVEFNKPINGDTITTGAAAGGESATFSFLVSATGGTYVPGNLRFDKPGDVEFRSGYGVIFDNRNTFQPGEYEVTLFGDEDPDGKRPAITATDGTRLDGEPLGLPSGDGTPGGNFTFKFVVMG